MNKEEIKVVDAKLVKGLIYVGMTLAFIVGLFIGFCTGLAL